MNWSAKADFYVNKQKQDHATERGKLAAQAPSTSVTASINELSLKGQRLAKWREDFTKVLDESAGLIEITRNLDLDLYSLPAMPAGDRQIVDGFCRSIVLSMPYILYNDDFQDRPPSLIEIVTDSPKVSNWQQIFANLFDAAATGHTLVETAKVQDQRRRDSIVSDVQALLNNTLAKAWKSFHLDRNKKVKIRLNLTPEAEASPAKLSISIVETIGEHERFFQVVDRSKGFLWFYNFVMKTEFNPKSSHSRGETVYLLDEPGSYLHSAAQTKLCEKLKSISTYNGKVIYCTHSPHLLHPNSIPINDIHIVTKSSRKEITVARLPEYKTSEERLVALQPIFEALQINGFQFMDDGRPMLAVEGIYDKYAISVFLPNSERFNILPCTSANSVVKNIQFLNAFRLEYVAIWDNDQEGRKELERAKQAYGLGESSRFMTLPSFGQTNLRMEAMFEPSDIEAIRQRFQLNANSNYETAMLAAFYATPTQRKQVLENLSQQSRERFLELSNRIEVCLKKSVIPN